MNNIRTKSQNMLCLLSTYEKAEKQLQNHLVKFVDSGPSN